MGAPLSRGFDHEGWVERALAVLALHLRHEVALHRALRGDSGREGFAGLLLDGDEAEAIVLELAGRLRASGTAEPITAIHALEAQLANDRRHPSSIWARLAAAFDLSEPELDLVLLAAAPGLDPRFGRVYGFLADDLSRRHLTPSLAARLMSRHQLGQLAARRLLGADRHLRRHGLVRLGPERPRAEAAVRLDEDLLDRLLGAEPPLAGELIAPPQSYRSVATLPSVARLVELPPEDRSDAAVGHALSRLAETSGFPLVAVAARTLLRADHPRGALLAHHRAARLRGAYLVVTETAGDGPPLDAIERQRLLPPQPPPVWVLSSDALGWHDAGLPTSRSRCGSPARARQLAALGGLAEPLRRPFDLADLVLPARSTAALTYLAEAAEALPRVLDDWGLGALYGKSQGMTALFKGPSGTGKTMAAQALANRLGRQLYRVDLAGLISKYIGETEKHLDRVFNAAEGPDVVLLFDEADAVFGKRSEVNDAHDRHANTGTAYLLQRLETHRGLSILTTNLQENIDEAFFRRIDAVVEFPPPGPVERRCLWGRLRQSAAPLDETLDFDLLATVELTGGEIRNCCLSAAYRAAASGEVIDMAALMRAVALELTKKGKPVRRADLGPYYARCKAGA
ncbi:MAG: AAA family ATPase [Acidimicrobiia bacterium]